MKPILVLNCGSSSIKYQLIDVASEVVLAGGQAQRIGMSLGDVEHVVAGESYVIEKQLPDHATTLHEIVELFTKYGPDLAGVVAVAHRSVHGGDRFSAPTLIDDAVIEALVELSPLAPLHNPAGIDGIRAAREVLPDVPHVAIFDTAFFTTLPAEAYTYAIDPELAKRLSIRKYGFHGTSHYYVSSKVSEVMRRPVKQVVAHIGNGASVSAVDDGRAIDTTLGLTPNQGLVMGTRSGDVDPGLHKYLMEQVGMSIEEVDTMLNKSSGMLALAGSSDMRDVRAKIVAGDAQAQLAFDVYVRRLVFYIGAYITLLGGCDVLTFTAGVGENDSQVRAAVVERLGVFGAKLNVKANESKARGVRVISAGDSALLVMVVPTNEELAMARQTAELIGV
ncbi:MAG: acetate kinase [Propionibacteriaceae bacterium]|jgi:acetate kinase|nr:acetate kinase [Propionibacteriaceae bacterium]